MNIVLEIHSGIRWLIVAAAVIAAVRFLLGWLRNLEFGAMDRGSLAGVSGLMDLQVLVGFVYFLWSGLGSGAFARYRFEHLVIMLAAALVAHLPGRWKNLESRMRFRRALLAVLGMLVLVFIGVSRLPGGWTR
jgi:uncharacterized membrane protein YphA (DoxX/SURF4 family)